MSGDNSTMLGLINGLTFVGIFWVPVIAVILGAVFAR